MKNFKPFLLVVSLFTFSLTSNAQTYSEGDFIFDIIAGGPNFSKAFVGGDVDLTGEGNEEVTGMLPIGARGEYMIADKFGIGLEITFASGKRVYDYTFGGDDYIDTWKHNKLRILPTFNFHFLDSDVADLYLGIGAGFKNVNYTFESTDEDALGGLELPTGKIAAKLALGSRFYFNDNIGLNVAFALGGPLVSGGLSFRVQ